MAEQPQNTSGATPEQLSQQLAEQRDAMGRGALLIRENLSFKKKLKGSVDNSPRVWMGAAVGTGLLMGVAVPRVAGAVGGMLMPKRRSPQRVKGVVTPEEQKEQSEKAATKGAAVGTLMGGFGSLLLGIIRPIIINMVRDQVETRLRTYTGGGSRQNQTQM